ncbi:MAG: hypothetical protein AAFQ82_17665, partial [Myxococcota bacterium]
MVVLSLLGACAAPPYKRAVPETEIPKPSWADRGLFVGEIEGERHWFAVVQASDRDCNPANATRSLNSRVRNEISKLVALEQNQSGEVLSTHSATSTRGLASPVAGWADSHAEQIVVLYRIYGPGFAPASGQSASPLDRSTL